MKKIKAIALLALSACLLAGSGCSLVQQKTEEDPVVAIVNGTQILKSDVQKMADQYAGQYGIEKDSQDTAMQKQYEQLVNSSLDSLVTYEILYQKAAELKLTLTDDEKASYRQQADSDFAAQKASIKSQVEEEAKIDASIDVDKETEKRYQAQLEKQGTTPDSYYEFLCKQGTVTKVTNYIYGLAELSDDELKAWYDNALKTETDEMESKPEAFEAYVQQRNIYVYVPEDAVAVKQVLLTFSDDALVSEATTLYNEGKKEEAFAKLQPEIDKLMPTAQTIAERLRSGENIDTLIKEFGMDPNMTEDPYNVYGYLVDTRTTRYGDEFRENALKLFNVGDTSDPFASLYGLHVLQSINVYKEGPIPFEDKKEEIRNALLPDKEDKKFTEVTKQWQDEADVTYYRERLL